MNLLHNLLDEVKTTVKALGPYRFSIEIETEI